MRRPFGRTEKDQTFFDSLPCRVINIFDKLNIHTIEELTKWSARDLLSVRNCGHATVRTIHSKLKSMGLFLRSDKESVGAHPFVKSHQVADVLVAWRESKTLATLDALQAELDREAAAKKFVEDSLANKNQGGVIQVPASRKVCLPHPVDENGAELPWVHPAEALYFGKSFINYVPTDDEDFFECENPIQAGLRELANDWEKAGQSNFANDLRACIPGEPREGVPSDVPACLEKIQKCKLLLGPH